MNQDYQQFTSLDFAQEDSFIRWVRQQDEQATAFWEKWAAAHPEKAKDLAAARQLVLAIRVEESPPPEGQVDRLWQNIAHEINAPQAQQAQPRVRSIRKWLGYVAAAASVAILLFVFFPKGEQYQELLANNGEQRTYYLPDSSEVKLNAGSRLLVAIDAWTKERKVQLEGEAFFKVRRGGKFVVETAEGSVEVLGTSFNVNARVGSLAVDCFSGKVRVAAKTVEKPQVLKALDGVKIEAGATDWDSYRVNPSRQATWRTGVFYFDKAPLIKVFAALERQFDLQVDIDEQQHFRQYTGFFNRQDLDEALNNICFPMGLTYTREAGVITITGNQ
ncbi:MAG: FecR domain-containing protein [Bacteroidota bacterium]